MSPYAVNTKKGTVLNNDDLGELQGGIAVFITDKQALVAKHLRGVVVFDKVLGVSREDVESKHVKNMKEAQKVIENAVQQTKEEKIEPIIRVD